MKHSQVQRAYSVCCPLCHAVVGANCTNRFGRPHPQVHRERYQAAKLRDLARRAERR